MKLNLPKNIDIIFEDNELAVLVKPPLLHSVANVNSLNPSLAKLILDNNTAQGDVSVKYGDGGLVHRLDYETSGLMILAKNRVSWLNLYTQLKDYKINKSYLALLEGALYQSQHVCGWIGSSKRRAKKMKFYASQPSSNKIRALYTESQFTPLSIINNTTLANISAKSAKRHQVRVHAAQLGHPLIGDGIYGSGKTLDVLKAPQPYDKCFFLLANYLDFLHPVTRERLQFELKVPDWIERLIR